MKLENELRIGNWIEFNQPKKGIYTTVTNSTFEWDIEKAFKPIQLTEEWLVNFGAKKFNHAFLYDRFRLIPRYEYGFYQVVDKETNVYITKVEFVHEWQNVVFVLNGQELILKTEL